MSRGEDIIPQPIRKAAWFRRGYPGAEVVHLGDYRGEDAYYVRMPEGTVTGYPPVFLLREGKAVEIIGEESLEGYTQSVPILSTYMCKSPYVNKC